MRDATIERPWHFCVVRLLMCFLCVYVCRKINECALSLLLLFLFFFFLRTVALVVLFYLFFVVLLDDLCVFDNTFLCSHISSKTASYLCWWGEG